MNFHDYVDDLIEDLEGIDNLLSIIQDDPKLCSAFLQTMQEQAENFMDVLVDAANILVSIDYDYLDSDLENLDVHDLEYLLDVIHDDPKLYSGFLQTISEQAENFMDVLVDAANIKWDKDAESQMLWDY